VKPRRGKVIIDFEFKLYLDYVRHLLRFGGGQRATDRPPFSSRNRFHSRWLVTPHIWHQKVGPKWSSAPFKPEQGSNAVRGLLSSLPPPSCSTPRSPTPPFESQSFPPSYTFKRRGVGPDPFQWWVCYPWLQVVSYNWSCVDGPTLRALPMALLTGTCSSYPIHYITSGMYHVPII
jgi:hypothetical protein